MQFHALGQGVGAPTHSKQRTFLTSVGYRSHRPAPRALGCEIAGCASACAPFRGASFVLQSGFKTCLQNCSTRGYLRGMLLVDIIAKNGI